MSWHVTFAEVLGAISLISGCWKGFRALAPDIHKSFRAHRML
jgi:hypothetical protein